MADNAEILIGRGLGVVILSEALSMLRAELPGRSLRGVSPAVIKNPL